MDCFNSMLLIIQEILGRRDPRFYSDLIMMEVGMGEFIDWLFASILLPVSKMVVCLEKKRELHEMRRRIKRLGKKEEVKKCLEKLEFLIADVRKPPLRDVFDVIYCHRLISSEFALSSREEIQGIVDGMLSMLRFRIPGRPAGQLLVMESCQKPKNEAQETFLDWWELRNRTLRMRGLPEWPILSMEEIETFFEKVAHEKGETDFGIKLERERVSTREFEERIKKTEDECRKHGSEELERVGIRPGMLDGVKKDLEKLKARIEKSGAELPPYNMIVAFQDPNA